jgi:hypothetical protein
VLGDAAFDARRRPSHLVLDADVGEGAAHHHLVVAAPRAVGVEVGRAHLMLAQILPAGEVSLIEPAGEMWSVVIESPNMPGCAPRRCRSTAWAPSSCLEIGRVLHIGRAHVPGVGLAAGDLDLAPVGVALEHVGVALGLNIAAVTNFFDELGDFLGWSARCPSDRPACRPCRCRAARWSGRCIEPASA